MPAELVAIFSAMGWATDSVLVRLGLRNSSALAAMLVSFAVSSGLIWTYLLANTPLEFLKSPAMIYFLISGCMQPLFARALFYEGITRMGVSRAGPLRGAEPFFAAAIAVTFFNEKPGISVYLGTALIFLSLWLISARPIGASKWRWVDALFPLSAALISAVSQSLRKQGLNILPDPFVATGVVTVVSLVLLLVFVLWTKRTASIAIPPESLKFFVLAALAAVLAQISNFVALGQGALSAIIPLLNTTPLFTVLFTTLFLRQVEQVTPKVILGAVSMVAGVALITGR